MKKRIPVSEDLRQKVLERDNHRCRYCGNKHGPFQVDHVYPVSRGGETVIENLITACLKCNQKKGNKIGWLPVPESVEELKRQAVRENFPLLGYLVSGIGFGIILVGAAWSRIFNLDFDVFLFVGVIVGFCGILVGLKGY
jgi:hypothetical protein